MSRRMEALLAKGDDIGSWSGKTIYSVDRLYEQAESLRVLAYQKYHANTQTSLQEAFVLLMRFAKFYDLISAQKAVKRDSAAHTKLKRDLLGAITTLEELKPRLLKMFGEAEPAPLQAEPEEEGRDELELRMQEQLEARWANLAPKPKPPPPKLEPPKPAPPKPEPAAAAAPTGGGAAAAAAGAVAGATAGMAAASLLPNGAPPPPPYDGVGGSMGGSMGGVGGGGGAGANGSASLASAASAPSISPPSVAPPPVTPPALAPTGQPPPQPPPPQPPQPLQPPQPPQPLQPPQPPASAAATPVGPGAAAPATGVAAPPVIPLPPKPPPSAPPAGGAASAADSGAAASGPAPAAGAAAGAAARAGADPPPSYAKYANTNYPTIARPIEKLPTGTGSGKEGEAGAPREGSGVADVGMRHRLSSGGAESASVEALRQRVKARQLSLSGKKEAQDPRSRLSRHLKLRGFTIKDVPGDNNCQFHALADQLQQVGISGWTATKVRRAAVQWLDENGKRPMDDGKVGQRTLLKDSVGVENWGQYINEMSQHGITWGDEATLLAASVLFKAEIVVISSLSEDYCHIVTPPDVWKVELNTRLYLGHYHEFHYVSTRPTGD